LRLFNSVPVVLVVGLVAAPEPIFAQERADDDHHGAVLEIGAASEWGFQDGKTGFGPSVAIEVTPIEHWLEIEAGISPLRSRDGTARNGKPTSFSKSLSSCRRTSSSWLAPGRNGRQPMPWARWPFSI
jgi:hypothetical protein